MFNVTLDTPDSKLLFDTTVTIGTWIVIFQSLDSPNWIVFSNSWNHRNIANTRITMWWTRAAAKGFTAKSTFTLPLTLLCAVSEELSCSSIHYPSISDEADLHPYLFSSSGSEMSNVLEIFNLKTLFSFQYCLSFPHILFIKIRLK